MGKSVFLMVLIGFSHCTTYSSTISCVSLLAVLEAFPCINEAFMFASFSLTTIRSSSEISLVFVVLRDRSDTKVSGEPSLVWDSLSLRNADVVDKCRGTQILLGVGLSFATVPIVCLAFATHGTGLDEVHVLSAFPCTITVV